MASLSDLLVGKSEQTVQGGTQTQFQKTAPTAAETQLNDLLNRAMIGQLAKPPETAISVPMQQAVSSYQRMMPTLQQAASGSLAQRLAGPAPGTGISGQGPAGASQDWTPGAGANQAGLQTREQLGLPDRSSYFTFMPSAQQVADIGLAPIRPGGEKPVRQAFEKQQKQQANQAAREARKAIPPGPGAGKARKAAATAARIKAGQGPSYL